MIGALAVAAPATAQRATASDALSDREFWQLFTSMSEEGGTFPSENFVSNEKTYQFVIPTLQRSLTRRGVYLGVGPEQNFTYIANLEPRLAVIFDIRRQNAMLHLMYKALFELSPSRGEFVSRLFSRPLPRIATSATADQLFDALGNATVSDSAFDVNWKAVVQRLTAAHGFAMSDADLASMHRVFEAFREAGPGISYAFRVGAPAPSVTQWFVSYAQLQTQTNGEGVNLAFLATEERYRWLRNFEQRNLVVPVVADFAGEKALHAVGDFLTRRGDVVSAFYTSNVEQYLFASGVDGRFYQNVGALPIDSTSMFIRSLPGGATPGLDRLLNSLKDVMAHITDSAGTRAFTIHARDSTGKEVTIRGTMPNATFSTTAYVSGIAPLRKSLDEFSAGRLKTYSQVTAMTKTDDWKSP